MIYMKIICSLAKLPHFGGQSGYFEFLNCGGVRHHHTQKRLPNSCSSTNLTIETGLLKENVMIYPTLLIG